MSTPIEEEEEFYHSLDHRGGPVLDRSRGIFRDGKFLIIRNGALLPEVCPYTGTPLTDEDLLKDPPGRRRISWLTPWAYCGILFGVVPFAILAAVGRKNGEIIYSLGPEARRKIRNRKITAVLLMIAAFASLGAAAVLAGPDQSHPLLEILSFGFVVLLIASLVFFALTNLLAGAGYREPGWFKVRGCSPAFLSHLPEVSFKTLDGSGPPQEEEEVKLLDVY